MLELWEQLRLFGVTAAASSGCCNTWLCSAGGASVLSSNTVEFPFHCADDC